MNIVELFGGIGAIRKALINLNIDYNVVSYVEVDKNAVKAYNILYNDNQKPQDVRDYDLPSNQIDILMHGSPCQDFSKIGKNLSGKKDSKTRSSLLYETIRILKNAKYLPKVVLWENVTNVLDKKHIDIFHDYLEQMEDLGYTNSYKILNSLDFGIPQNRNRIFVVSTLKSELFNFDNLETKPTKDIEDFLEKEFHSRYIVKYPSLLNYIKNKHTSWGRKVTIIDKIANTITTKQDRIPNSGFIKLKNDKHRTLTERECFKLMGFSDTDFDKLYYVFKPKKDEHKSSTLYRLAGNSIVVPILEAILKEIKRSNLCQ